MNIFFEKISKLSLVRMVRRVDEVIYNISTNMRWVDNDYLRITATDTPRILMLTDNGCLAKNFEKLDFTTWSTISDVLTQRNYGFDKNTLSVVKNIYKNSVDFEEDIIDYFNNLIKIYWLLVAQEGKGET